MTPVEWGTWNSGNAVDECAQLGDYLYAYKFEDVYGTGTVSFDDGHENTITVTPTGGGSFDFTATSPISAVIAKAGPGANVYTYVPPVLSDTGLMTPRDSISHVTLCWNPPPVDEEEDEYGVETAWGEGPRYVEQGTWAMYTPYQTTSSVDFIAGQHHDVGDITFTPLGGATVLITIDMNNGAIFGEWDEEAMEVVSGTLHIDPFDEVPTGKDAKKAAVPGQFDYHYTIAPNGDTVYVTVPLADYYGIHGEVALPLD